MRCRLCGERAGLRLWCRQCRDLWAVWQANRGAGFPRLLRAFAELDVAREQVERFLDAEPKRGGGTIRDHIAAEMANQLLDALGQKTSQDAASAKRLRDVGNWKNYDQRPEE